MVIRTAAIMQSRTHRGLLIGLRITLGGCLVFVPALAGLLTYIAFGPVRIDRVPRVRR